MDDYSVTITLKSNTVIGSTKRNNVVESLDYIPGTTLRGALAEKYLNLGGGDDFNDLFLRDKVIFPNLYPTKGRPTQPLPKTAFTCKTNELDHFFADLLPLVIKAGMNNNPDQLKCSRCGALLKQIHGYVFKTKEDAWKMVRPSSSGRVGVQIHEARGTAAQKALYFFEGLNEKNVFNGTVKIDSNLVDILKKLFYEDDNLIYFGKAVTRGRGKGEALLLGPNKNGSAAELEHRLNDFNNKMKNVCETGNDVYFTITCLSDCLIIQDGYQSILKPEAFLSDSLRVELITSVTALRMIAGWQNHWGLPKRDEAAIEKGSVFVYKAPTDSREALINELNRVTEHGIGIRRNEGFGKVSVCDSFHLNKGEWR